VAETLMCQTVHCRAAHRLNSLSASRRQCNHGDCCGALLVPLSWKSNPDPTRGMTTSPNTRSLRYRSTTIMTAGQVCQGIVA
jgi:hypothetical protein